jgi:beta-glucosidase
MKFGAATAAFQIEGATRSDGRGESIWDRFCRTPGAVLGGDTGDVACDHYARMEQDLDLMVALGLQCYRFSISWPRVMPDGAGAVNQAGLDFYRRLVEGLLARDIEPIATLYHWDLPQALQDGGGWPLRDTAGRFAEYAGVVASALDGVGHWITQNEPWVAAFLGHAEGTKAPGLRDWPSALRAAHHLLLSHGLALPVIREAAGPSAKVGIALNLDTVYPAGEGEEHLVAAARLDGHMNRWFLDPLHRGTYPEDIAALYERHFGPLDMVRDGDLALIAAPIDFLGVNYYRPHRVRAAPDLPPLGIARVPAREPVTAMGWEVDPASFTTMLGRITRDYGRPPIYVTENGAAYEDARDNGHVDDPQRTAYLEGHLRAVTDAIAEGADVRRYCVWSLLDNFEWELGYSQRFGIVHVDYATQRRTPKASALWYRDHIARAVKER